MKKILQKLLFTATVVLLTSNNLFSQNVAINASGAAPVASAMLDIASTSSGLLIPRMSTAQRTSIGTPATGLLVYDTTTNSFWYYNGAIWIQILNTTTGWLTTGNAGTSVATNFLGTTDNNTLAIRTNNTERMRVLNTGQVAINSITAFGGDVFSSYAAGTNYAINAYTSGSGAGIYSSSTSTGFANISIQSSTGGNMIVSNTNTATNRAGEFQSLNTTGTAITLFATNSSTSTNTAFSAIWGQSSGTRGIVGLSSLANANSIGVNGQYIGGGNIDAIGVLGLANSNVNWGYGVFGQGNWRALQGNGNFAATGTKAFQIDHPLDPENKFLLHYSIESPEVLNMYRGTIILDANGEATIELPDYFVAININYSYLLTPIGASMPNLFVLEEINENGKFKISGGVPNKKITWVVYSERNDEWVKKYPLSKSIELDKKPQEKGKYLRPELYNQPQEKAIFNFEEKPQAPTIVSEKK